MNEPKKEGLGAFPKASGRRAVTPAMVAVALIAIVGIVGAVNYVVLNAIGVAHSPATTTTNSTTTCHPSTAPQCKDNGRSGGSDLIQLLPLSHAT
ncbi:MAG: hypothetical protein ACLPZM_05920 [Thermoplasmata archaeon]